MQDTLEKKKKKKHRQTTLIINEEISESGQELLEFLQELEADKKYVDVQICPECKSPKVKRVNTDGDPLSHMGLVPPKYECSDCGWNGKILLKITNRPLSVKDVELMLEALNIDK
jgi:hypothetical protein